MTSSRIAAVIPVKHTSDRVKSKNFRVFDEETSDSLLDILIKKLKNHGIKKIYISSNSPLVNANNEDYVLIPRDDSFCNNDVPWSDVIANVLESIPEPDDTTILWCHTTNPLFNSYSKALQKYLNRNSNDYDSLVAVSKNRNFILTDTGLPVNYAFGPWHKYSQFLPNFYNVAGSLFIGELSRMKNLKYVIGINPILFHVEETEAIDIDTEIDFKFAQFLYKETSTQERK